MYTGSDVIIAFDSRANVYSLCYSFVVEKLCFRPFSFGRLVVLSKSFEDFKYDFKFVLINIQVVIILLETVWVLLLNLSRF